MGITGKKQEDNLSTNAKNKDLFNKSEKDKPKNHNNNIIND